jgi:hypothetical protein
LLPVRRGLLSTIGWRTWRAHRIRHRHRRGRRLRRFRDPCHGSHLLVCRLGGVFCLFRYESHDCCLRCPARSRTTKRRSAPLTLSLRAGLPGLPTVRVDAKGCQDSHQSQNKKASRESEMGYLPIPISEEAFVKGVSGLPCGRGRSAARRCYVMVFTLVPLSTPYPGAPRGSAGSGLRR